MTSWHQWPYMGTTTRGKTLHLAVEPWREEEEWDENTVIITEQIPVSIPLFKYITSVKHFLKILVYPISHL